MTEFVQNGILVLVSAGLGFAAARWEMWSERRRSRKALASALLSELRWIDGILRQIVQYGPASYYDPLQHPMTETAIAHLTLFDSRTIQKIAHFHGLLRDVHAGINEYRERPTLVQERKQEYARFIKGKAYFAATAIHPLVAALTSLGGEMPPPMSEPTIASPDIPKLPPSAFGKLPADDTRESGEDPR